MRELLRDNGDSIGLEHCQLVHQLAAMAKLDGQNAVDQLARVIVVGEIAQRLLVDINQLGFPVEHLLEQLVAIFASCAQVKDTFTDFFKHVRVDVVIAIAAVDLVQHFKVAALVLLGFFKKLIVAGVGLVMIIQVGVKQVELAFAQISVFENDS